MKANLIAVILFLFLSPGFSQSSKYEYHGRRSLTVKKEKLNEVVFINDITPELWQKLVLPQKERDELEQRRRINYPLGYYLYPQGGYDINIDYISVEILASCDGKILTSRSTGNKLNTEQKNILNTADLGSDISIKVEFRFKNKINNDLNNAEETILGHLSVTVVPETEAEFPGGNKKISEYLAENFFKKASEITTVRKIQQAVVKFTVNEVGQIIDVKISRSSTDPKVDKLLLDVTSKMVGWKPAKNSSGVRVKQEFSIPFGNDGC
jgi:TonB family protein